MEKRQLFHVKNVYENEEKKSTSLNGRMDFLVTIIELLRFLYST